ncbi:hypothetical protein ACWEQ8_24820, partial [Streptomyces noursei]
SLLPYFEHYADDPVRPLEIRRSIGHLLLAQGRPWKHGRGGPFSWLPVRRGAGPVVRRDAGHFLKA